MMLINFINYSINSIDGTRNSAHLLEDSIEKKYIKGLIKNEI